MRRATAIVLVLALAGAAGGCATVYTTAVESDFSPYGGVQGDFWLIETTAEPRDDGRPNTLDWMTVGAVSLDVPLSAVADTLLLPYTLTVHQEPTESAYRD